MSQSTIITLLGGKVKYQTQPPWPNPSTVSVWLAACAELRPNLTVLDAGCGGGTVGLCLLARQPTLAVTGVDNTSEMIELAEQNATLNQHQSAQFVAHQADVTAELPPALAKRFDITIANPPYYDRSQSEKSPTIERESAHGAQPDTLLVWYQALQKLTADSGQLLLLLHHWQLSELTALSLPAGVSLIGLKSHAARSPKNYILKVDYKNSTPRNYTELKTYDEKISNEVLVAGNTANALLSEAPLPDPVRAVF